MRYGGKLFERLNGKILSLQFVLFSLFIIFELIILYLFSLFVITDKEKIFVLKYLLIALVLYLPFSFLKNLLQLSGRISEFARLIFVDRLVFMIGAVISILCIENVTNEFMISDIIAKFVVLILAVYYCFSLLKSFSLKYWKQVCKDIWANIYVGYNLMFANIASY